LKGNFGLSGKITQSQGFRNPFLKRGKEPSLGEPVFTPKGKGFAARRAPIPYLLFRSFGPFNGWVLTNWTVMFWVIIFFMP